MIDFSKYRHSYSMWAWAVNKGPFGAISNTLNFFNTLVNNKLIEYTKLSTQTSWDTYIDNGEVTGWEPISPASSRNRWNRDKYTTELTSSSSGLVTTIIYKSKFSGIRLYWQGIPIEENKPIMFSYLYEQSSMYFTRADTGNTYFFYPQYERGVTKTYTIGPFKKQ